MPSWKFGDILALTLSQKEPLAMRREITCA